MNDHVKISIIVPVYNAERYIDDCIQSIIRQTYTNWELILVDDGSTDDSQSRCRAYEANDSRIHVLHQKNSGQGSARNNALDKCTGEYITFVDSDDLVHERLLEDLLNASMAVKADISIADIDMFYTEPDYENKISRHAKEYNNVFFEEFVTGSNWKNHVIVSKLYRTDILREIRFPEYRAIEDEFFLTKVYAKARNVVVISNTLYFYRQTENSTMRGGFKENRSLIIDALLERANVCAELGKDELATIVKGQCLLECMDWWGLFYKHGYRDKASLVKSTFKNLLHAGMKSKKLSTKDQLRILCFRFSPQLYHKIINYFEKD